MTDDLEDLKAAMRAATPMPDPGKKAADLALAKKTFAKTQGSREDARQTSDRPENRGFVRGVKTMLSSFSTRSALTASTALVALGLIAVVPVWQKPIAPIPMLKEAVESEAKTTPEVVFAEPMADVSAPDMMKEAAPAPILRRIAPGEAAEMAASTGYAAEPMILPRESNTEAFPNADQNPLKVVAEDPVSTFSIDVDTASYSIVRSSLTRGQLPPEGAVRIEEMINEFPYDYPAPQLGDAPFQPTVSLSQTPWNPDTKLLHIAIQGIAPEIEARPPLNLVFLIDTSGSMDQPDKLPLLKQAFALMLPKLGPQDQVAIVTYAGSAGQVLEATPATDRAAIMAALDRLDAGGSTAGEAGLQQAYSVAEAMAEDGEVTRVILATDGDFNVGLSDPAALESYIARKRDSGTYLSVMGFGRGNLDDATMQALAQNGNGQASYIDTLSEAQKVLVDQFTGALFPIADDVKTQVEFNPAKVAEYRLIGYETRALNREDFNNDRVDAGEIGAGHSVTAIYEITPVGSPARLTEPLRYGAAESTVDSEELGFLRLRYKQPGEETSRLIEAPIPDRETPGEEAGFATAIAGFGQLLTNSPYLGAWGYDEAIALANATKGEDAYGYRAEAIRLMRLAKSLSL